LRKETELAGYHGAREGTERGRLSGRGGARVFLTFDDGPDPIWTPRVLEALRLARASATFFLVAPGARRFPDVVHEMLRAGHAVGLHCTEHVRHTERARVDVEADTAMGLEDLRHLGTHPRLWRPPWGMLAPWTEAVAASFGLEIVSWTADTHDWRGDAAPEMLSSVDPMLGSGAVVLMHDGLGPGARRSGCEETVALIGALVERIRSLGCEPAPIDTVHPQRKASA
jgi:peptidoglycan/xylan/chitin deacetylase (PgdA/CDA1 family)